MAVFRMATTGYVWYHLLNADHSLPNTEVSLSPSYTVSFQTNAGFVVVLNKNLINHAESLQPCTAQLPCSHSELLLLQGADIAPVFPVANMLLSNTLQNPSSKIPEYPFEFTIHFTGPCALYFSFF